MVTKKPKPEGKRICKCECGGEVRGINQFERLFTWCESCTPIVQIKAGRSDHERR